VRSDLQIIGESFTKTLVSLYHHRIEYPGQKKAAKPPPPSVVSETNHIKSESNHIKKAHA